MKIHIIGCSGSGKTYLAKALSEKYTIPHFDLDDIQWDNNAAGLVCFFIWYSIVVFHEMSMYPIAYTCSIFVGLLSLVAFITAIIFYIRVRKKNLKPKGIIIDILTSITTLPILFLLVAKIFAILQSF